MKRLLLLRLLLLFAAGDQALPARLREEGLGARLAHLLLLNLV